MEVKVFSEDRHYKNGKWRSLWRKKGSYLVNDNYDPERLVEYVSNTNYSDIYIERRCKYKKTIFVRTEYGDRYKIERR